MATNWVTVGPLTDGGSLPPYVIEAGGLLRQTLAQLDGDLNHADGTLAFVYADPQNNGKYIKAGETGTGSWVFVPDFTQGNSIQKTSITGIVGAYTVVPNDDFCIRGFDTTTQDGVITFNPADPTIRNATQVWFYKNSANHDLYLTTDGIQANAIHIQRGTRLWS